MQGAYIVNHLFNAIPNGTVIISTPDTNVPTTNSFIQGLRATTADVAFLAPSIVVTLAREPRRLEFVRHRVKLLMYCGGTIPEALGNVVASKLRLVDQYGASEIGLAAAIRHRSDGTNGHSNCNDLEAFDDAAWSYERQSGNRVHAYYTPAKIARPDRLALGNWNYVRFHPSIGSQMRHYMGDMYELVIARNTSGPSSPCSPFGPGFITTKHTDVNEPHPDYFNVAPAGKRQAPNEDSQAPLQPAFAFFPHALEYHTRDLWSPHPTKPGLWLLRARVDDLFTLSTGQIINPVPYEHGVLAASQDVEGVLLFGHGRSQPGLLIELRDGNDDEADPSDDGNGNGVPSGDHITTKLANSTDRLHSEAKPAHRHENLAARRRLGDTDGMSDVQRTPTPTPTETYERLWSAVQTVNGLFPPHMRVNRELLILADPASPMHRAGKGTTQRQLTLGRYQEDIERAYADAERGGGGGGTGGDG
ncbi:MAG: hypothetical protein LQ340_003181 [Diploschistes diacapsis]|nr:MAG: hypothetical protein LQ340_003181 [Diploschistes diacapsis]